MLMQALQVEQGVNVHACALLCLAQSKEELEEIEGLVDARCIVYRGCGRLSCRLATLCVKLGQVPPALLCGTALGHAPQGKLWGKTVGVGGFLALHETVVAPGIETFAMDPLHGP